MIKYIIQNLKKVYYRFLFSKRYQIPKFCYYERLNIAEIVECV